MANTSPKTTTPAAKPADAPARKTGRHLPADVLAKVKSAPAWRPMQGATVTGTIVTIVPRDGDFGRYPVVVLDTGADHYQAVHAFHGVIQNELREMRAAPGERITIRYDGKRDHNKAKDDKGEPRQYHSYSVVPTDGAEVEEWNFDTDKATQTEDDPGF